MSSVTVERVTTGRRPYYVVRVGDQQIIASARDIAALRKSLAPKPKGGK